VTADMAEHYAYMAGLFGRRWAVDVVTLGTRVADALNAQNGAWQR